MVLLIVDAQQGITNPDLYNFPAFEDGVKRLIAQARKSGVEVIFIRHDDGPGTALTPGAEGFPIYEGFRPLPEERVFDKQFNSAFRCTGLLEYLDDQRQDTVIIAGLQTEYCIDATIKAAFEHGLSVIVPENANTTFDNAHLTGEESYRYYNQFIWKNRYARCLPLEDVLAMMEHNA